LIILVFIQQIIGYCYSPVKLVKYVYLKTNFSKKLRKINNKYHILPYKSKPTFEAKIKNKKIKYDRKSEKVTFTVKYRGGLKQGFTVAEIIPPSKFDIDTPNLDSKSGSVSSFCNETVKDFAESNTIYNIDKKIGKLHGHNIEIDELNWEWTIPEFAPLGNYKVIIGIYDRSHDRDSKLVSEHQSEESFYVVDSDSSHYRQRVSF
jgi:hypothetical protein